MTPPSIASGKGKGRGFPLWRKKTSPCHWRCRACNCSGTGGGPPLCHELHTGPISDAFIFVKKDLVNANVNVIVIKNVNANRYESLYLMSNAIAERIEGIEKFAGITAREVAQLLGTTPETISRWRGGRTEPQPKLRDSLLQLEWLVSELAELYRPQDAHLWLFSPHKLLKGERPVDLIERGESEKILQIIAQLKDGAYT